MKIVVRDAVAADLPGITAIYAHHVRRGLASFEYEPPGEAQMRERYEAVKARGYPYLSCEIGGALAGFAYASAYRPRPAYRCTLEDSLYVDPAFARRGAGRALLAALIERCATIGCRQLVAVIGDSGNAASIDLHAALGFERVGTLRSVGYKHGRWVDSVLMQRAIGPGDASPPEGGR